MIALVKQKPHLFWTMLWVAEDRMIGLVKQKPDLFWTMLPQTAVCIMSASDKILLQKRLEKSNADHLARLMLISVF